MTLHSWYSLLISSMIHSRLHSQAHRQQTEWGVLFLVKWSLCASEIRLTCLFKECNMKCCLLQIVRYFSKQWCTLIGFHYNIVLSVVHRTIMLIIRTKIQFKASLLHVLSCCIIVNILASMHIKCAHCSEKRRSADASHM